MSTRWHFNSHKTNNASHFSNYKKLDTNPDHYKSLDKQAYKPKPEKNQDDYVEGTQFKMIDGSVFRTKDYTVDDVYSALHESGERWLELTGGGEINLGYVTYYKPFKFYKNVGVVHENH